MKNINKLRPIIALVVLSTIGVSIWWFTRPGDFLYAGTIEGTEVTLSARVPSVIKTLLVKEGDAIQKDQVLLTLAGEDLRLAAKLADTEFNRAKRLLTGGSITQASYDKIRFQQEKAQLAVAWCSIQAPLNGRIEHVYKEVGEMVAPGMQLVTLTNIEEVWAYIYIEQPKLAILAQGMEVQGSLPELSEKKFVGTIAMIRDQAEFTPKNVQTRNERARLVYGVKVRFANPNSDLKPGMTIEVKLPVKTE
jgi:membrane fusion protein YbhG